MTALRLVTLTLCWMALCPAGAAETEPGNGNSDSPRIDYLRKIKPVLRERCFACHGPLKQEASLRLDTGHQIRSGGDSGAAVIPQNVDDSILLDRITARGESGRMPPEGKPLTADQIELIREWVRQGASSPDDETPEPDPRKHWAFQPPRRPDVPAVEWQSGVPGERVRNPIDAFVADRHLQRGINPAGEAPPHMLLRRVHLDVLGLPPKVTDLKSFLESDTDETWPQVVDRLLDDPAYGERWGRHWMDVWRYSDWYGRRQVNDVRNSYPHIWRWRDWIVNSLNKDTGYDQMLRMMLAADELDPENDENIAALGFIVRNWFSLNYDQWMKDQVEHTGKAFLGLRLNCAHCHDHKYDPITQREYFQFRAFFEPLELRHDRVPGGPMLTKYVRYKPGSGGSLRPIAAGLPRVFDENLQAETYMYRLGDARDRFDEPPVSPGAPLILGGDQLSVEPIELPARAWYPGLKEFVHQDEMAERETAVTQARSRLATSRAAWAENEAPLTAAVKLADEELAMKRKLAGPKQLSRALSGEQSLVLDAGTGRSVLANQLPGVTKIDDSTRLRFLLRLETDTYTALGLTLDHETGRTGGYVAFRAGKIVSYRAGQTHAEFVPGTYNFEEGQRSFEVTFDLKPSKDQFLLSVVTVPVSSENAESAVLVDRVPAALHGWNVGENSRHMLSIDARAGAVAVYDNFELGPRDGEPLLRVDFEHPEFTNGGEATGHQGWGRSKWTVAPGKSHVSRLIESSPELKEAEQANRLAHRARDAARLKVEAAEQQVLAAAAELEALRERIEADRHRFLAQSGEDDLTGVIRQAVIAERKAQLATAQASLLAAEAELAGAEAKPLSDDKRAKAIQDAGKKVSQLTQDVATKRNRLAKIEDSATYTSLSPTYPRQSTGRRSALARWLTHADNPLPARVAVNHIWLRHFGRPLVDSVFDFGNSGSLPTHPKLLDWLAVEFVESGWSMKHIHRLILTSQTYRMGAGRRDGKAHETLLSRYEPRRLEAEVIRDCMLHVSGRLDRTMGGQEVDPGQESTSLRRSLYFSVYPEAGGVMPFLEQFDAPDPADCYRRTESIVPQQALAMNNSDIVQNESRRAADRLIADVGADTSDRHGHLVTAAFVACLSKMCTDEERRIAIEFLDRQTQLYTDDVQPEDAETRALASLIRVLFSHNDFVTLR